MTNRSIKKPLILFGFLLYPIYTLPWIIKYMLKNQLFGYILFSLMMAYLAYLMVPYDTMDITRHYEKFNILSNIKFDDISQFRIFDYIFNVYMWSVNKIGLSKEFLPFSLIFIQYILYFITIRKIINYRKSIDENIPTWLMLLGLFLIINEIRFIGTASGLRNGLAFSLFIYTLLDYYIYKKRIKFLILSLLSIVIHVSVLPLLLLFIISKYFPLKRLMRILFILSLILIISGMAGKIFYSIIGILEPYLREYGLYFHAYMEPDGAWGSGFYADKNIKTIILEKFIKPLPFYLIGIYLIKIKNFKYKSIQIYLYYLYTFIALVSVSRTMLDRYSYFFVLFFVMVFILEINTIRLTYFKKVFIAFFISAMLLMDLGNTVKYRDIIVSWKKVLYIPAPYMLLQEIKPENYIKRESL